jgi:Zn-dependent M28 family amino/carboxypeptidase
MIAVRRLLPALAWLPMALVAPCASTDSAVVPADRFLDHVAWLADDARRGRDTASPELYETAEWVAEHFRAAGLKPLGDSGGWLQRFTVSGRRTLLDGNALVLGGSALALRRDWIPLQSAMRAEVEAPLVFAGYGISDPEGGWDDYAGLDVKGKIVLALRKGPRSDEDGSRYAQNGVGGAHITFSSKVNAAFRNGAAALIVVNDPAGHADGRRDRPLGYQSLGQESTTASLPAVHVTLEAVRELLAAGGLDLAAAQQALDAGEPPAAAAAAALDGLTARVVIAAEEPELETVNVVGLLPGSDPVLADEYVLIGAHMDHVGLARNASSRGGREALGQIHNGADDNASGTAGVVEIARLLAARRPAPRRSVIFATWSGEEWGLLGSRYFTGHPPVPLDKLTVALNMDMIGRSKDGYVAVEGVGSSAGFPELVRRVAQDLPELNVHYAPNPSRNSDQASFFEKDIPVLHFFTGLHEDYHMPSDDTERINAQGGAAIATLAGRVLARLADVSARPPFTAPAVPEPGRSVASAGDPHAAATDELPVQAYRVVFGTSPDMAYQAGDGVRLTAVRADTPAERAGLKAGDRIVAFDGKTVRNLQDYSVLLFSHLPGDTVTVTVQRGEETLDLTAELEGPAGDS